MPDLPGFGPRAGGYPYRCDLLPPRALLDVAAVLRDGSEKHGPDAWRALPVAGHVNHALAHLLAFLAGDTQEAHLAHAAARLLFAGELAGASG